MCARIVRTSDILRERIERLDVSVALNQQRFQFSSPFSTVGRSGRPSRLINSIAVHLHHLSPGKCRLRLGDLHRSLVVRDQRRDLVRREPFRERCA
jgi:hypothetical protein